MLIKRREFIQAGSLVTASLMLPKFLKALEQPAKVPAGNKVLVVLQLSGGNDGLNTVIPVRNDIYYRSRPVLGIQKENSLLLNDEVGLNPALPVFRDLAFFQILGAAHNWCGSASAKRKKPCVKRVAGCSA